MTTTRPSPQKARRSHPSTMAATARLHKTHHEDEMHLIHEVAAQDHDAFEMLYHRYRPRLMAFLTPYLVSAALCEEVFHEVLLIVWDQAGQFNATTPVSTWIFGIARHKALQARAVAAKWSPVASPAPPAWRLEDIPEEHVLQQAQGRAVAQALMRLPPEQRTALTLVYYQDCSYAEIAARTGYPLSTVQSQVRQAQRRLATLLAGESCLPPHVTKITKCPDRGPQPE